MLNCPTLECRSYEVWNHDQARYDGRSDRRAYPTGRDGWLRVWMDFRLARSLAGAVSAADADGDEYEEDAARHVRYESCDARHHCDCQPFRYAEPDFQRTHAAWDRPRRQFAARAWQKARDLGAARRGRAEISGPERRQRDRLRGTSGEIHLGRRR